MSTTNPAPELDALRYPTGRFVYQPEQDDANRATFIETIRSFPERFRSAVKGLPAEQLDTPYRPEGWTARQVVHHVADSHLNAYIRFKLALTEPTPTIKPYDESAWAKLPDTVHTPIEVSLDLLDALHRRWSVLLEHMTPEQFSLTVFHPEYKREISLARFLALYAWHGNHHLGHVGLVKNKS